MHLAPSVQVTWQEVGRLCPCHFLGEGLQDQSQQDGRELRKQLEAPSYGAVIIYSLPLVLLQLSNPWKSPMCNNPCEFSCAAGAAVQAAGGLVLWPQHSGTQEGSISQAISTVQTDPRRGERTNHTDVEGREKSMGRVGAKAGREIGRGVFKWTSLCQRLTLVKDWNTGVIQKKKIDITYDFRTHRQVS